MTNEEFNRILKNLKKNDLAALEDIYNEYFQKLKFTALCIVRDNNDAYDIAMNVILKLVDIPIYDDSIKNHVGFLITITRNESINFIKKKNRSLQFDGDFDRYANSISDNLWIKDILEELTEDEKDVFIEHCIWGISLKVIAKKQGKSYATVVRTYSSIKDKIKQLYS